MLRMCLSAVVLNDSLILFIYYFMSFFLYLISELYNVFCLFIYFVCFVLLWFVYLLLYVLCSLNQGIAAKEPCAQSILPE